MIIRPLRSDYRVVRARSARGRSASKSETKTTLVSLLETSPACVFVANRGHLTGFLEASLREDADGCATSPVGYVEGWYVLPNHRLSGVGRALIEAAEDWARVRGCTEMASDALLDNTVSHQAHQRVGYAEVERAVRYRKNL
jgi:aminoglycoside 6'-N-acetyltransferase I